jgi:hypothetical protein
LLLFEDWGVLSCLLLSDWNLLQTIAKLAVTCVSSFVSALLLRVMLCRYKIKKHDTESCLCCHKSTRSITKSLTDCKYFHDI